MRERERERGRERERERERERKEREREQGIFNWNKKLMGNFQKAKLILLYVYVHGMFYSIKCFN